MQCHHVDEACPRFLKMKMTRWVGLGHKIAEVVFGVMFAQTTNSTFIFDEKIWSQKGGHGSCQWLPEFLPLHESKFTLSDLEKFSQRANGTIEHAKAGWNALLDPSLHEEHPCNVAFTSALHWCGEPGSPACCNTVLEGVCNRMKWRMREACARTRNRPRQHLDQMAPASNSAPLTVVWHLRGGDIVLNGNKDNFDRLSTQITGALKRAKVPAHVFFFAEKLSPFPFLSDVCQALFDGQCSHPVMDSQETLFHLVESDVLSTSGSGFAAVAALLRTDGITLNAFPKEKVVGIYEVEDQGQIGANGSIEKPSLEELAHQLRSVYNRKMNR